MKIKEVKQRLQEGPAWDELKGRMGAAASAFAGGSKKQQATANLKKVEKSYVDSLMSNLDQAIKSGYVVMPTTKEPAAPKTPQQTPAPDYSKYQSPAVNRRDKKVSATPGQQVNEVDWDQRLLGLLGEAKNGISIAQWVDDYVSKTFNNYEMRDNDPAVKYTKQLANHLQSVYNPKDERNARLVAAKIFGLVNTVAQTRQKVNGGTFMSGAPRSSGAKTKQEVDQQLKPKIISQEPIVMDWDGKRYGLDDKGQWIHLRSGQVQPEALQKFLSQQHDASLGISK